MAGAKYTDSSELDPQTKYMLGQWLQTIRPHIANICEPEIREEGIRILRSARAEGLSYEEAEKRLPNANWITWGLGDRYLSEQDAKELQAIRNQIKRSGGVGFKLQWIILALTVLLCLFLMVAAALTPAWRVELVSTAIFMSIFALAAGIQPIRVMAIASMGPIGSAIVSYRAFTMVFLSIWALYVWVDRIFTGGTLQPFIFYGWIIFLAPGYVAAIRRYQRNRELVGRILGLPGYGEEEN